MRKSKGIFVSSTNPMQDVRQAKAETFKAWIKKKKGSDPCENKVPKQNHVSIHIINVTSNISNVINVTDDPDVLISSHTSFHMWGPYLSSCCVYFKKMII